MASQKPSSSIVVEVLRIFRDASKQQRALTALEIVAELSDRNMGYFGERFAYLYYDDEYIIHRPLSERRTVRLLDELSGLGILQPAPPQADTGTARWQLGEGWKPPIDDGDSGNLPPPRDGGAGGNDPGNNGGAGLREVLGHPLLFSLDHEEFGELVDGLFSEVEP